MKECSICKEKFRTRNRLKLYGTICDNCKTTYTKDSRGARYLANAIATIICIYTIGSVLDDVSFFLIKVLFGVVIWVVSYKVTILMSDYFILYKLKE